MSSVIRTFAPGPTRYPCPSCTELLDKLSSATGKLHSLSLRANVELLRASSDMDSVPDETRLDLCAIVRAECEAIRLVFVHHVAECHGGASALVSRLVY